jgi:nitrate/nitrite-specific signal transduction histidine kinase
MNKITRRFFFATLLVSLFIPSAPMAAGLTMGQAIDKAGRQRMLTQRMVKAYSLAGQKLKPGVHVELKAAAKLFNSQLEELTAFVATNREKEQIKTIKLLWSEFRPEVTDTPSQNKASEINDLAELLLQASHKLVVMLEKRSGSTASKLVNMAGRQRMLSQRIAKIYLLQTWRIGAGDLNNQYTESVDQFGDALDILIQSPINTPDISEALRAVQRNWDIFGISNFSAKYNTRVPSLVVRSMDRILVQMNGITAMYAALDN